MTGGDELIRMTARQVVALLDRREVSPLELIDAALARIDAVDGAVNALPVRCPERARDRARRLMAQTPPAPGTRRGWLAGLPLAIKDSMDVAGVRSTHGSPIFADHVPGRSDLQVEALERNGGVVLARSNAPEFAAGANTFNEVFGRTLNPWNTAMSCGGSSGGSAVALATGEVWLANGSDLGGSLRIPASFCSVVGLRPGAGVVPHGPDPTAFDGLAAARGLSRRGDRARGAAPHRLLGRSRVPAGRTGSARRCRCRGAAVFRARRRRRGGGARFRRRGRDLPDLARAALRRRLRAATGRAPRPAQARDCLEHRAGLEARRRGGGARTARDRKSVV